MKINAGTLRSSFSIQRLAYYLITLCILLTILYIGAPFFIPIVYGIFFAFMLKPIANRFERVLKRRVISIVLTMLTVFLTLAGILTFFIVEIAEVVAEADGIVAGVQSSLFDLLAAAGEYFGLREREVFNMINQGISGFTEAPMSMVTAGLSVSGTMLASFSLIIIYTFFFLLYSTALKNFVLGQLSGKIIAEGESTIREIQNVATDYLGGMLTVMIILGVLNSLGLYLIGVKFALVWGFLGAMLAIIPYVGTFIGGMLPFLYSIATTDTYWQPIAVVALYMTIQSLEGNIITPKVVGNSVKINALAAIVSLIFGAIFWGVPGVILAIPLLAMIRVILDHIDATKPVALLLSDELYGESDRFLNLYNRDKYRLRSLFKGNKVIHVENLDSESSPKRPKQPRKTDPQVITNPEAK